MSDTPGPNTCPKCGDVTLVMETRATAGSVHRRRMCRGCGHRLTSIEVAGPARKAAEAALRGTSESTAAEVAAMERLTTAAERLARLLREDRAAVKSAVVALLEWVDSTIPAGKH